MDLRTTGTIGVLLLARQSGLDIDLRSSLDALIASGFRLSRDVYQQIVSEHN
jgi:predicted nucleic acid-binding protein